ncbi:MAG: glycosyltransferase [Saprospiraceae bacterium]
MTLLLFLIFIGTTLVQLFYWLFIFSKLALYKVPLLMDEDDEQAPISVIICARNEAENLKKNLDLFLNQNYRSFEIIVVNDHSTDQTAEVVLNFQKKYANLRLVNCSGHKLPGKKAALTVGIKAARYDTIALSDADCQPASPDWLRLMQGALRQKVKIGLGYSPYQSHRGFLNLFIRFETIYTAIQYFSFALMGMPYMGVGRNLIYSKSVFFQTKGFQKHQNIASGDDDLFVNEAAQYANVQIVIHPGAFVFSEPKRTWRGYYHQKSRHLSTATSYQGRHQVWLGALSLSHALHYLLAISLLLGGTFVIPIFITVLVRMAVVSWTYYNVLQKLQAMALWRWIPLLDAAYVLYYLVFAPALLIGRKDVWKQ